jgi:two-component system, chemotaxis family, sensor kinase Cph1
MSPHDWLGTLSDGNFLPHGFCFAGRPDLIWLHVVSDAIVALAYFMIPVTLTVFIRRYRMSLSFNWAIALFAAFILLCGTGHVLEIWTIWQPIYYWQGIWKALTAAVSLATAFAILPLLPKLLAMKSPEELEAANQKLAESNALLAATNTQLQAEIKARVQAEADLQASLEEVQRTATELEQFAYIASHDLQAPLRTIAGFAQLLEKRNKDQLDADGLEFLGFIHQGVHGMQSLIDALLKLSRIGRAQDARYEAGSLTQTIQQALRTIQADLNACHALVQVGTMPVLSADHRLLAQLFQNLVGNAAKFSQPGSAPVITIDAADEGEHWHLTVRDNGIGIAPEQLENVFAIFRRLHTQEEYEGSGIGLAICRKIVSHHGGSIWVTSEGEGQGATFHVRLPKQPPERSAPRFASAAD